MNKQRFSEALRIVTEQASAQASIGTLGEKTLHAVLKQYYLTEQAEAEVRFASFVADIVAPEGIIEIQTRGFDRLRRKLDAFLPECPVSIVYPLPHTKWLCWIDPETGLVSKRRKSPKTGVPQDAFFELYKIKRHLSHPNLTLRILLLDVEEYRLLNGWSHDRKRGSSRHERIPIGLVDELVLARLEDYRALIPATLEEPFRSEDFRRAARIPLGRAQTGLNILHSLGAVQRIGKQGNAFLYTRAVDAPIETAPVAATSN